MRWIPTLFAASAVAWQQVGALSVTTPSLTQCRLSQLRWTGAQGQIDVVAVDAKTNATLRSFFRQPPLTDSLSWMPTNVTAGTAVVIYSSSQPVTVQPSDDTGCISPSSSSSSSSASTGSSASSGTRTDRGPTQDTPPQTSSGLVPAPSTGPSPTTMPSSTPAPQPTQSAQPNGTTRPATSFDLASLAMGIWAVVVLLLA
ncbi:uncharacterized protein PSFLO_00160 [Pseudozyma flocculosa]|uniref:Uncharacterized protein n=1 Tax=Pseudozyma flocculosa TaxID=84751 RepID=A0A5C3EUD6_9BASI|nr:uncharacterized protein PSFLO_00160 [Pseudozyma flocculosa]